MWETVSIISSFVGIDPTSLRDYSSSISTILAPNDSIGVEWMGGAWTTGDDGTISDATRSIDGGSRIIVIYRTYNVDTEQYDVVINYIHGDTRFSTTASGNARTVILSTSPLDDEENRLAPTTLNSNGDVLKDAGWTATFTFSLDRTTDGTDFSVTRGEVSF